MLRKLLIVFLGFISLNTTGQMTVENDQTVQWYVENVLLGSGVSVSNITFNGQPADQMNVQCGYFASNGSYMEVESGLVLSSGGVTGDDFGGGEVIVGESTTIFVDGGVGGDPDLEALSNENINDQAVLEFDFIPTGDTLRFNYVFGSEEYPEYVNSFNDAFGFFLSGPGISGPFSSPAGFPDGSANIALIPGTATPVTIDNVNNGNFSCGFGTQNPGPCTNCEFYVDNCPIQESAMDGMTTVLEAFALVQCGETYHIKLAIGDALDGAFDSAVFLQEGSFQSSLTVSASLFSSIGPSNTGYLYENCGFGTIEFSRGAGIESESIVELVVSGVGENGVDFTFIPPVFTFPAGDSLYYLDIYAFIDGLTEGLEEVNVMITNTTESACFSGSITSEFTFYVSDDPEPLAISVIDHDIDCGDEITIGVDVTGGYGQYLFDWSNGATTQNQTISPGVTTEYTIIVTDTCNAGSQTESLIVTVPVYPPLVVELDETTQLSCLEEVIIVPEEVSGGNGVYNYLWTGGDGSVLGGNGSTLTYTGSSSELLTLTVTDGCSIAEFDQMFMDVPVIPIIIDMSEDTVICLGDIAYLNALASGGEPPYEYSWSQYGEPQTSITASPQETTIYTVSVTDLCDHTEQEDVRVHVSESTASFSMSDYGYYGVELENFSSGIGNDTLMHLWDLGDGATYTTADVTHTYFNLDDHTITLIVSNEHGCADSLSVDVLGPPSLFVPSSFTPNNDGINDRFQIYAEGVVEYRLMIFDRWGGLVFETTDLEESWNGQGKSDENFYAGNDSYVYHVRARMRDGERVDKRGTLTLIR
jgi:gliding motility-associated-like protein